MKQLMTAAIALTLAAGMTGMAQAQTSPNQNYMPPAQNLTSSPPGNSSSSTMPNAENMQGPQANAQNVSKQTLREAQRHLRSQGLYNGRIDGVDGPRTQAAVRRYQQKNGLPETATLDQETLNHILGNRTAGYGSSAAPGQNAPGAGNSMNNTMSPADPNAAMNNPDANTNDTNAANPTTAGSGSSMNPAQNTGPLTPNTTAPQSNADPNAAGANGNNAGTAK